MNCFLKNILLVALLSCLLISCEKSDVELYGDETSLIFEMFSESGVSRDSMSLSFPLKGDECTEDTLWFKMRILGRAVSYDREIKLKINDEGTTAQPENYKLPALFIPANAYSVDVPLVVYRKGLKGKMVRLELQVEPNEHFGLGFSNMTKGIFWWGDIMMIPDSWYASNFLESYERYFGEYSETKYVFILKALNFEELPYPYMTEYLTFKGYNEKVRAKLFEYNAGSEGPLMDENGDLVSFPESV